MVGVRVENLTKRFGPLLAVDHVSLDIKDGELMCMLGPSGCGKTTTLRMIAGLEVQDEGNIYIGEELVNDLPPKDRDIGMIFQFYAMYPGMKVFDQLAFPLKMRKASKEEIRTRVKKAAEALGLDHLLNSAISQLTVEQRQKVEVGRAIVRAPKVYLWDEPLTNLDAGVRLRMRAELKRLQKDLGTTTIYVTHDQLEAIALADRIAVMNQGRVLQFDTPHKIYDSPNYLFVAGFIGSPAMNFIEGSLQEKRGRTYFQSNDFVYDITEVSQGLMEQLQPSEVTLGVRPENVAVSNERKDQKAVKAAVTLIEPVGFRMIVHLKLDTHEMRANIRSIPLQVGDAVWVKLEKAHLFDRKSGNLLT